jgi:hypothetical protein
MFLHTVVFFAATPPFDVTDVIKRQAVPQIKSGQYPPIYSKNHRSAFLQKPFTLRTGYKDTLLGWCEKTFQPSLLVEKTHGTTGQKYRIVPMVMSSLAGEGVVYSFRVLSCKSIGMFYLYLLFALDTDSGLPLYRPYDREELAVFHPSSELSLMTFDSNGERKHFRL